MSEEGQANNQQHFSTDLLRVYYGRLFPYESLFNWLSYGNDPNRDINVIDKTFFSRREFSFTIEDDIYIRYQSYRDLSEFTAAIQKRQPHKIDIGAVFNLPPKDHNTVKAENFKTMERELVFDIDMTDYDDIRTCCSGANICAKCWPYMTMALKVVDQILREDFGFRHILWIYSGRRGIHCWVCDKSARELENDARSAVVQYMSVETSVNDDSSKKTKQFSTPFHPMIRRAYETLEPFFRSCIADETGQGLLGSKNSCIRVLNTLPFEAIRKELYNAWEKNSELTGAEKWDQIKEATTLRHDDSKKHRKVNYSELEAWRVELVLHHCYPRLDANVSKAQNHLLKSPFCVHPKTGRVCVPIDPEKAEEFDPTLVPTVRVLCDQVDAFEKNNEGGASDTPDYQKTSLRDAIECFERTFMQSLWASIRRDFRNETEKISASTGDF